MNRNWSVVAMVALLLLAGLAVAQWQKTRQLNEHLASMDAVSLNQKRTLTEQAESIGKLKQELLLVQRQFARAEDEAKTTRARLLAADQKVPQIIWERDRLQAALSNSVAISLEQAKRLQQTETQLAGVQQRCAAVERQLADAREWSEQLSTQLQSVRQKFGQLTTNHNVLMARYNSLAAQTNFTSPPSLSWPE
jgi:chromosome segregation ATPase